MPRLPTGVRRRRRDKALAASRRPSTGPEWERHVFTFNPGGWLGKVG
jgi:hypothetical protein